MIFLFGTIFGFALCFGLLAFFWWWDDPYRGMKPYPPAGRECGND